MCNIISKDSREIKEINMAKTATRKKKQPRVTRRKSAWEMVPLTSWYDAHYHVHYQIEVKDWLNQIKGYVKKN